MGYVLLFRSGVHRRKKNYQYFKVDDKDVSPFVKIVGIGRFRRRQLLKRRKSQLRMSGFFINSDLNKDCRNRTIPTPAIVEA